MNLADDLKRAGDQAADAMVRAKDVTTKNGARIVCSALRAAEKLARAGVDPFEIATRMLAVGDAAEASVATPEEQPS